MYTGKKTDRQKDRQEDRKTHRWIQTGREIHTGKETRQKVHRYTIKMTDTLNNRTGRQTRQRRKTMAEECGCLIVSALSSSRLR